MTIKVGIIGFGLSAQVFHFPLLLSNNRYEVVSVSSSRKEVVLSKYPNINVFDSPEELIKNSDVNLIVITAP
eukprot:Pgem_evm1s4997